MTINKNLLSILISLGILIAIYGIAIFIFSFPGLVCYTETICHISTDLSSPAFDCNIIYSRLSKYQSPSYIMGSRANIQATACSQEVLAILSNQFNKTFETDGCNYICCITDGTFCEDGTFVTYNNQGYEWR